MGQVGAQRFTVCIHSMEVPATLVGAYNFVVRCIMSRR